MTANIQIQLTNTRKWETNKNNTFKPTKKPNTQTSFSKRGIILKQCVFQIKENKNQSVTKKSKKRRNKCQLGAFLIAKGIASNPSFWGKYSLPTQNQTKTFRNKKHSIST